MPAGPGPANNHPRARQALRRRAPPRRLAPAQRGGRCSAGPIVPGSTYRYIWRRAPGPRRAQATRRQPEPERAATQPGTATTASATQPACGSRQGASLGASLRTDDTCCARTQPCGTHSRGSQVQSLCNRNATSS
eukprot:scaffold4405_cov336-Prasinococcus_capsulatus_cf.AAC.1